MKLHSLLAAFCALFVLASSSSLHAETLAEHLEAAELGALIGTWVDEDSSGEAVTITYNWQIKDHALAMTVKTQNRTSFALIGIDPKSGDVVHTSIDNKGGAGAGKWAEEDGVATLTITVVDSEKKERTLKVTHKIVDENKKLEIGMKNVENDEGGEVTLVRKAE